MSYDDVTPPLREFLGTYEVLRRLGFVPGDIFFQIAKCAQHGGKLSVFCTLKTQGKEFAIECGFVATTEDEACREYQDVTQRLIAGEVPEDDHQRMFYECEAFALKVDLIMAILKKGIRLPKASNDSKDWS